MSDHFRIIRLLRLSLIACLLAAATAQGGTETDTLNRINGFFPAQPRTYDQVGQLLGRLDYASALLTVEAIGQSHNNRDIWLATATDSNYPPDQKIRLFIIARQHGTECAGTTAMLALVQYLAAASSDTKAQLLRYFEIAVVPVANPDGCVAGRRTNAQDVDLNRDWGKFTQPETQAIRTAIIRHQPHAVVDLHELPANSRNRSYAENFIETIGSHDSLPALLCANTVAASHSISYWMKAYGYPLNVYYDYPGDSLALCHRYWGLSRGIASFLCESKTGTSRSLQERAGFHVLAILGIINHLGRQQLTPVATGSEMVASAQPTQPPPIEIPLTLAIRLKPAASGDNDMNLVVHTQVEGSGKFGFVTVNVDGVTRLLTTQRNGRYALDTSRLSSGQHAISAELCSEFGAALSTQQATFTVPLAGVQVAK